MSIQLYLSGCIYPVAIIRLYLSASNRYVFRESKRKHVQLIKDRKVFEAKITEMDAKCNEEMILKFGRLVDLEELEQVTVNRQVEELKEKLRTTEIECSADLKRWEVSRDS